MKIGQNWPVAFWSKWLNFEYSREKQNISLRIEFLLLLFLTKVLFHDQRGPGLGQVSKVIMFTPSLVFGTSHDLIMPCARHSSRLLK